MWVPVLDVAGWGALEQLHPWWSGLPSSHPPRPLWYCCLLAGSLVKEGDLSSMVCFNYSDHP